MALPLRVTRHRVPWPGLGAPVTVAHLTDVHVGWSTPQPFLAAVAAATRDERPDLVALTGDYVNTSRVFVSRLSAFVAALPPPVVAVLGNHDHLCGARAIGKRLEAAGARVLRNESCEVAGLSVVGVDDGFTGHDDPAVAFARVEAPHRALVLTHFPPTADRLAAEGRGRLVLAGHTHAGQFELPGEWTRRLARVARLGGYLRGFHDLSGTQLYVNAGVGHARRGLRVGELCRPELALFRLEPS